MTWKMKVEEVECVLEKIWDLHDKLSDAIHSISRTHFLRSVNSSSLLTNSDDNRTGFVFIKGFPGNVSAIRDARSLNSIRTALENLQDQLEFVHSVQIQQLAERSVAIARLEQRRIVLALRLGEHQGKNYEVIDEARAFVGAVHDATNFASPVNVCGSAACPSVTMLALLHMQKVSSRNTYISHLPQKQEDNIIGKNVTKISRPGRTSSNAFAHMDVLLARG
ncbi:plastid division protein PDV1-like isoform X2 [Apium graveolens]|uniref:plastid division protein PDV1-like isoform X2 n=1 Tax=Apium graveolens TaxID=4045 RepID=UPI003D79F0ED